MKFDLKQVKMPFRHQEDAGGGCSGEHEGITLAERDRPACVVYESPIFQEIAGETLHPGGFALTRELLDLAKLPGQAKLLDIGCGNGAAMRLIRDEYDYQITGIDQSAKLLEQALALDPSLNVQAGEADFLEFPSFSFDGVLMECVFSLCEMKEEALHEAYCVLKKGGKLLLSDLYDRKPEAPAKTDAEAAACCLNGLLNQVELTGLVEKLGFANVQFTDRSTALKDFAARAIMKYGSLDAFWAAVIGEAKDSAGLLTSLLTQAGKAGYYLLVAEKPV